MHSTVGVSHSQQARTKTAKKRWILGCCGGVWNWTRNIFTLSWWLKKRNMNAIVDCLAVNHLLYILPAYSRYTYDWNMNDDIVLSSTPFSSFCAVVSRFTFAARHVYSSLATPIVLLLLLLHLHVFDSPWLSRSLLFFIWNVSQKVPNNNKRKKSRHLLVLLCFVWCLLARYSVWFFDFTVMWVSDCLSYKAWWHFHL